MPQKQQTAEEKLRTLKEDIEEFESQGFSKGGSNIELTEEEEESMNRIYPQTD